MKNRAFGGERQSGSKALERGSFRDGGPMLNENCMFSYAWQA